MRPRSPLHLDIMWWYAEGDSAAPSSDQRTRVRSRGIIHGRLFRANGRAGLRICCRYRARTQRRHNCTVNPRPLARRVARATAPARVRLLGSRRRSRSGAPPTRWSRPIGCARRFRETSSGSAAEWLMRSIRGYRTSQREPMD